MVWGHFLKMDFYIQIFFSNGVSHGPATLYLTNGDTEERTYENGVLHGIATFASHNGDREERYVHFFWLAVMD